MTNYEIEMEERHFPFDKNHEPVLRVQRGDQVKFNTIDCFSGQFSSGEDLIIEIDFDQVNPRTGPVYVDGAEVGDVLVVHIDDIEVEDYGVGVTYGVGYLKENSEIRSKVIEIDNERDVALFPC